MSEDLYSKDQCPFNEDGSACSLGVSIGVIAIIGCILFLVIDARFDNFSNIKTRRRLVIADLGFALIMSLFWFITFCYLANEWRKTSDDIRNKSETHKVQASIAFAFFSIITWVITLSKIRIEKLFFSIKKTIF